MKIGLSTSVIQHGKTGVAQYVFSLVKALLPYAQKHEFTLFVLEDDLDLFDFARYDMRLMPISEKFRPPVKDILWHHVELPRMARRLGLDVLHIPSYRRMIWQHPCRLVATIHDLAPFHVPNKYDWRRMFYARTCVRRLVRRQHEIIAISQTTAHDINRFFQVPLDSINVVYNGIDHDHFNPGNRAEASRLVADRYGLERPYFIYVSRLEHPAKNHVRLITSFNTFKASCSLPWQLVFAGGDWHGSEIIHAAIRQSPFGTDIRSLGFVPNEDIPLLYRAAGACVYPSLYEGFGLPPLEAMACGCPVISSNRGSLGEIVGDAAIQLDPEDLKQWKLELTRIAADAALREQLRAKGLAHAEQFDWHKSAAGTLAVYQRALRQESGYKLDRLPRKGQGVPTAREEKPALLGR